MIGHISRVSVDVQEALGVPRVTLVEGAVLKATRSSVLMIKARAPDSAAPRTQQGPVDGLRVIFFEAAGCRPCQSREEA